MRVQGTPYRGEAGDPGPAQVDARTAFRKWARSVLGAPRQLDAQITGIEERDEVIVRVATEVVRRDLTEGRAPSHRRARRSVAVVAPAAIDPFAHSLQELREATEHTDRCLGCGGGGVMPCPSCGGGGRQKCGGCGGSGQVLRHYKKSSRYVRCTVCRGGGTVGCGGCGSTGTVTCQGCAGSGEQLVWWAYVERVRVLVRFAPESAILAAHPRLREERFLGRGDLGAFTPFLTLEAAGPIARASLSAEDAALRDQLAPVPDRQLERIRSQQFLRFGVLRRDVRYEMCGAEATVVLSGAQLVGATTGDAVAPIRRRLFAWGIVAVLLCLLAAWYGSALSGPTTYFEATNRSIAVLLVLGACAALVLTGGALRALRPGMRFWPIGGLDRAAGALFTASVLVCPIIAYVGRPRAEEAREAITAGDLTRAKMVIDALGAVRPAAEVNELADEMRLAGAERLPESERLAELDTVAGHGGSHAEEAKSRARALRIRSIEAALDANNPGDALTLLDRWATALSGAEHVDELRARALDGKVPSCADDACRYVAARAAHEAHATPEREAAVQSTRSKLVAALAVDRLPAGELLARTRALRELSQVAAAARTAAGGDLDLAEKARATASWVAAERAKVPLIGVPSAVVDEILERSGGAGVGWPELGGIAVHASVSSGRIKGLYVVGATKESRSLSGKEGGLQRLLAQATGRPEATLRARPSSGRTHETVRWVEGGTTVVARWNGSQLMELRIGDASP